MQITVQRTGGIAGVNERLGPVDTDHVSGAVGSAISAKVEAIGFFDMPSELEPSGVYDDFHMSVHVVDGGRDHTVSCDALSKDPAARGLGELVKLLTDGGFDFEDQR